MNRFLRAFCFVSVILILICCKNSDGAIENSEQVVPQISAEDTITVVAVGDLMLGTAYPSTSLLPPDNGIHSFRKVQKFLKGNVIFGNLEGCLLDTGTSVKCKNKNTNCYAFRMPEAYGSIFKRAGFNLLSIANNHMGDFEHTGRRRTAKILDSLEIAYAGQLNKPFTIFKKDSITYGFAAFAPNENTVSLLEIDSAQAMIAKLKQQVDIVIVSFHGGAEGTQYEHVTRQTEMFMNENRGNVYEFAHAVIDAGADLVLGHGPHVTRAVEVYKNKFIAYSLGNFCTYGKFNLAGPNGIAPLLQIKLAKNGNFLKANVISTKQDKINRLQTDQTNAAFRKIQKLTNEDFPGHQLQFTGNNEIKVRTR